MRRPARPGTPQSRPAGTVRQAALRLLGRRDYTSAELTARLVDRGFLEDEVTAAVAGLIADGAIDDERTARSHVRISSQAKGRGRLRILAELRARGVDEALAREALTALSPDDDRQAIERFVARRHPHGADPFERDRLFRQLLRRGFAAETIAAVLKRKPPPMD